MCTDAKYYVGRGATAKEQAENRAATLALVMQRSENDRRLKLSTRSNRLALLKRAAEKRKRRRLRNLTQEARCI